MRLVFLGPPGCGKGTQAALLIDKYGLPQISTGDLLRAEVKVGSELGLKAQSYMKSGELVPDQLVVDILAQRLTKPDCQAGFILDGFPRNLEQAKVLDEMLKKSMIALDAAFYFEVPDPEILKRLSGRRTCENCGVVFHVINKPPKREGICDRCGLKLIIRPDDQEETIKARLEVYHAKTSPLVGFYKKQDILKEIDGTATPEAVKNQIEQILAKHGK